MPLKTALKVMVVDDMTVSRNLVARSLDNIGINQVVLLDEPKKALAMIDQSPQHIIISDFNMPNMDGLDLLLALKKKKHTQRIGFILMSGQPDANINDLGKRIGMNNFIKKPFSDMEMKRCLEAVTGPLT